MTGHYLVATGSVHTTATACDYLLDRIGDGDRVTVLSVGADRDGADALNVATARLTGVADLSTVRTEGDPPEEILAAAQERGADVLLVGAGRSDASAAVGPTTRAVLAEADLPVVVLPNPDLEP